MAAKIKKILLIVPPAYTFKAACDINPLPPLGLGYLASVVRGMGIDVKILDCLLEGWDREEEASEMMVRVGLRDRQIEDYISDFNPDVVGINCQFSRQYKMYHHILSVIKKASPSCITIAGGAHASVCPEEILNDHNCDYILIGEAEDAFRDFILRLNEERDLRSVDGIGMKVGGSLYINEKKSWIADLDRSPLPSYDIMGLEKYFGLKASHGLRHRKKFAPIMTSRGCPAKCTFCSASRVWGNSYRFRSVDNVLEEMRMLRRCFGIEEIMFEDDNVTANPKRAKELFLRMAEEKLNFVWDTPNGVGIWSVDEEMIDLMKRSGCISLNFPVESGSQRVVNNVIKKPINLSKVERLTKYCKKIDLAHNMFLVIGVPGETVKDIRSSFRFAARCGCYEPHISVATPYPGTDLFEECKKNNLFARSFKFDDLFIKSFMIKTDDWSECGLRKILSRGLLYLKIRSLLADPEGALRRLARAVRHPEAIFRFMKDALSSFKTV